MKLIGYWIRSLRDEEFPPPQELTTNYAPAVRERVANYLDAGAEFEVYRGISWCRFYCDHPNMGCRERTDGEWVWPETLSHYVRDHYVKLPDEFIECACSKLPKLDLLEERWQDHSVDQSFWISWCASHRSNSLAPKLKSALQNADVETNQLRAQAIMEREQEAGVSDVECQWSGCHNRALMGCLLCASCTLEPEWPRRLSAPYLNLRPVLGEFGNTNLH